MKAKRARMSRGLGILLPLGMGALAGACSGSTTTTIGAGPSTGSGGSPGSGGTRAQTSSSAGGATPSSSTGPGTGIGGTGTGSSASSGSGGIGGANRGGAGGGTGGTSDSGTDGGVGLPCEAKASLAPARIWRLGDAQYRHALERAFNASPGGASTVRWDAAEYISEGRAIGITEVLEYDRVAEASAQQATSDLLVLLGAGCPLSPPGTVRNDAGALPWDDGCVEAFIRRSVPRIFRRPISNDEVADLMALYRGAAAMEGTKAGIDLVIQQVLMSPFFLYRTELGTNGAPGGSVSLTDYELASALSFTLLETPPDDLLWNAAADGSLGDPAVLASHVDRQLAQPIARANLADRVSHWLGIDDLATRKKDPGIYPEYTTDVRLDLDSSVRAFVHDIVWKGRFSDLFTSSTVYVNERLGSLYGIPGAIGSAFLPIQVVRPERSAGLLSQPGFLAALNKAPGANDIPHRGFFLHNVLLCGSDVGELPGPAGDERTNESATEREKATRRSLVTVCNACHQYMDSFGLAFERYDALGRYSEHDFVYDDGANNHALSWRTSPMSIDTSTVLPAGLGQDLAGPVSGLNDLAARLNGAQKRTTFCGAKHVATYVLGHNPTQPNSCSFQSIRESFSRSGSFADLARDIVTSPAFRTRDFK